MQTDRPSDAGERATSLRAWVDALRERQHVPLSFIEGDAVPGAISMPVGGADLADTLDELVRHAPGYMWSRQDGHAVLYPRDEPWTRPATGPYLRMPRLDAATAYVEYLRQHTPELDDLTPPLQKGDPLAAIYTDPVEVPANASALQAMVALLGGRAALVFTIAPTDEGLRALYFETPEPAGGAS